MRRKIALKKTHTDLRECVRQAVDAAQYVVSGTSVTIDLDHRKHRVADGRAHLWCQFLHSASRKPALGDFPRRSASDLDRVEL